MADAYEVRERVTPLTDAKLKAIVRSVHPARRARVRALFRYAPMRKGRQAFIGYFFHSLSDGGFTSIEISMLWRIAEDMLGVRIPNAPHRETQLALF